MEKYTAVMILPSLVLNEKLVCVGRIPKKDEVITWLREAMKEDARQVTTSEQAQKEKPAKCSKVVEK